MRRTDREVKDRALICGMLDMSEILHIAIKNEPWPYIVPVNFGYEWQGETLVFYFHCAKTGMKLDLLRRDPRVSVNAAVFVSYAGAPYRGHFHDYRSVTACGEAEEIPPDDPGFLRAHERLLAHNHRQMQPEDYAAMRHTAVWQIRCSAAQVWGKAEIVPTCAEELPFAQPDRKGEETCRN